ncbi:MAG: hypothetical protein ACI845_002723 [Gammaproteobacteria bacterium]|jgi:uncharacterized protein (DUF1330 family)
MQTYLKGVLPILVAHGGSLVFRGKTNKAILGEITFGMLLVMDFDSTETIEKLFESAEYKAIIPKRDRGFKKMDIAISSAL